MKILKINQYLKEAIIKTFIIDKTKRKELQNILNKFNYIDPIDYMLIDTLKIYNKDMLKDKKLLKQIEQYIK